MAEYSDKVTTPVFRVGFESVFKGKPNDSGKLKYDLTMVFAPGEDISKLEAAVEQALDQEYGSKRPKSINLPFKSHTDKRDDGDRYCDKMPELYSDDDDAVFIRASSYKQPGLVDGKRNEIIDEEDFFSGCYARATLVAATYETQTGKKGVCFYLNNIQMVKAGDRIGSPRVSAEDDFEDFEDMESVDALIG